MWRFDNRARIQPDETPLLGLEPRLTQIGTPLYSISVDPQFQRELLEFLKSSADTQRAERPQAVIAEAISRVAGGNGGARLAVKAVAQQAVNVASAWGVEAEFTAKRVGSIIRSFGFETHRAGDGYHFSISAAKLRELRERYQTK